MLKVNDTVRHDPQLLASWPEWARDYYGSRVGKVIEDEYKGWVKVRWDKPKWFDAAKFEAVEIAECLLLVVPDQGQGKTDEYTELELNCKACMGPCGMCDE